MIATAMEIVSRISLAEANTDPSAGINDMVSLVVFRFLYFPVFTTTISYTNFLCSGSSNAEHGKVPGVNQAVIFAAEMRK